MRTELVLDALDMAIAQRNPTTGLVHHSDHGCQRRFAYGRRLAASELVASMGTVGDALDNAVAEIFFATLECELLDRYRWPTRAGLRTAIFDFIEVFYNRQRRHSTLDHHPPAAYEQHHASAASAASHRVHGNGATPSRTAGATRRHQLAELSPEGMDACSQALVGVASHLGGPI